jgi:hypothetical protein
MYLVNKYTSDILYKHTANSGKVKDINNIVFVPKDHIIIIIMIFIKKIGTAF